VRTYARDDFVVSDDDSDDVEESTALFLEHVARALALRPRRYESRAKAFVLAVSTEPTFDYAAFSRYAADATALPTTIVDDFREICRASPAMQRLCALADDGYIPARVLDGGRRAKFVHVASNTVHVLPLDAPFNTHYIVETVALVYRIEWFAETLLLKELATDKYARCANVDVLCKMLAANTKSKFVAYIGERFEEMVRAIGE